MVVYLTDFSSVGIYEDFHLHSILRRIEEWVGGIAPDEYADVKITTDNLAIVLSVTLYGTLYAMRINRNSDHYCVAVYATPKAAATLVMHARRLMEALA